MSKIQLLNYLENQAKNYRKNCLTSIKRNKHMNQYEDEIVFQTTIDAILVDFINFIGVHQGVDYGLYTKDVSNPGWKKN